MTLLKRGRAFATILALTLAVASCAQDGSTTRVLSGTQTITGTITVRSGETVILASGANLSFAPAAGIVALDGGTVVVQGTELDPVICRPLEATVWQGIRAAGAGSSIEADWLIQSGATIRASEGAAMELRDCYIYGYTVSSPPIVEGYEASSVAVTRCLFEDFYELHFYRTLATVSDSVLQGMVGDGIDFDNSPSGCLVSHVTIRDAGTFNVDAIDFGTLPYPYLPGSRGTVDSCRLDNVSDKGVSVGELALGVTITNTLILGTSVGIASKDSSEVTASNVTIVGTDTALSLYEERADLLGGHFTGTGLILASNAASCSVLASGVLTVSDSYAPDISGEGNQTDDPDLDADYLSQTYPDWGISGTPGASQSMLARAERMFTGL
jgi:hypothetical protein